MVGGPGGVTSQVVLGVDQEAMGVRYFLSYFCARDYFWRLQKGCVTAVQRLCNGCFMVVAVLQF